ncbi:MAG: D-tyrosyl-tRNA(Tyr) deacylase [Oscillospiraceae bacterium]|nr:D-tyrosyl-tRNA(Tyr) deacylase [Oscillospiraceae bacterium]
MRAVVTRVTEASVTVGGAVVGAIGRGYLILLGVGPEDTEETARNLAVRICNTRVFEDPDGKMNLSLSQIGGSILAVSQFTLYADLKSRRPGFSHAAPPALAEHLYETFKDQCRELGFSVQAGVFGADMQVSSVNDGPVTLIFDTDRA